ncbi:Uncharacterised protein [uncultured Clostridium sp.]|nr:Uncharacterised protein [uncultured Clostridium sp.]
MSKRSCDFANGAGERHRFNNIHPQHFCKLISCSQENQSVRRHDGSAIS